MAKAINGREIPEGAATAVENWARSVIYNRNIKDNARTSELKATTKGTEVEYYAIGKLAEIEDEFYLKNEVRFDNEWIVGTPDIVTNTEIIDIKCPWDISTFPIFEEELPSKIYWWQMQGYMWLTGLNYSRVVYMLIDAPEHLIQSELKRALYLANCVSDEEIEAKIRKQLTFDDVDDKLKIKSFKVERSEQAIEQIKNRVEACQRYAETLLKRIL